MCIYIKKNGQHCIYKPNQDYCGYHEPNKLKKRISQLEQTKKQKPAEKIVYVEKPVEKIVYVEKPVEKIVYVESPINEKFEELTDYIDLLFTNIKAELFVLQKEIKSVVSPYNEEPRLGRMSSIDAINDGVIIDKDVLMAKVASQIQNINNSAENNRRTLYNTENNSLTENILENSFMSVGRSRSASLGKAIKRVRTRVFNH